MNTKFKQKQIIGSWLDLALETEQKKYKTVPIKTDLRMGCGSSQTWGYTTGGYGLMGQSLHAILYLESQKIVQTYSLFDLFGELSPESQDVLREYHDDFLRACPKMRCSPLKDNTLDQSLINLDTAYKDRAQLLGSFYWKNRIQAIKSKTPLPYMYIDLMHEMAHGCIRRIFTSKNEKELAMRQTYSWRLHQNRRPEWDSFRMLHINQSTHKEEKSRIEVLWGPDYKNRFDYLVFHQQKCPICFGPLPEMGKTGIMIVDRRDEMKSFDSSEALRSIGFLENVSLGKHHSFPPYALRDPYLYGENGGQESKGQYSDQIG